MGSNFLRNKNLGHRTRKQKERIRAKTRFTMLVNIDLMAFVIVGEGKISKLEPNKFKGTEARKTARLLLSRLVALTANSSGWNSTSGAAMHDTDSKICFQLKNTLIQNTNETSRFRPVIVCKYFWARIDGGLWHPGSSN